MSLPVRPLGPPPGPPRRPFRRSPRHPWRLPGALLVGTALALGALVPPAFGENGVLGGEASGKGSETGGTGPAANGEGAGVERSRRSLQPRWIEPRRRDLEAAVAVEAVEAGDDDGVRDGGGGVEPAVPPPKHWTTAARIVVHGERSRERLTTLVAGLLEDLGVSDVERRVVPAGVTRDQVRFFDATDAAMAADVAAVLEPVFGEVRVRDFTHHRPAPESGLLEIWLR